MHYPHIHGITSIYPGAMPNSTFTSPSAHMPAVREMENGIERTYDITSRLYVDRIIILYGAFDTNMARSIISQLLYLDSQDSTKPIEIYINSPGGVIDDGLAIMDTMKMIKSPVHTIVSGLAASMGAFIAAMGDKRFALPNARIMIHQPLGGASGQATEIQIAAQQIQILKEKLCNYLSHQTKKPFDIVWADMERDNWMSAATSKDYGLIDDVISYSKDFPVF